MELRAHEPDCGVPEHWPRPPGTKRRPGRWFGELSELISDLERHLQQHGPDSDYTVQHTGSLPRGGLRWFAPGVPMRWVASPKIYAVPALAALNAAQRGLLQQERPPTHVRIPPAK